VTTTSICERLDVLEQKWIREDVRIELFASFLTKTVRYNEHGRIDPDKWTVRVTDLEDPRNSLEAYYDYKHVAKSMIARGHQIDSMRGNLLRKRRRKITKRITKMESISNRSGTGTGTAKAATKAWIEDIYTQFPNARPDVEKERMYMATLLAIYYYKLRM